LDGIHHQHYSPAKTETDRACATPHIYGGRNQKEEEEDEEVIANTNIMIDCEKYHSIARTPDDRRVGSENTIGGRYMPRTCRYSA